jgi:hypothetical protein
METYENQTVVETTQPNDEVDFDEDMEETGETPEPAKADVSAEDKKAADDKRRREFEESEAKRKAEWDAKQAAKKAAEEKAMAEFAAMSEDELMAASVKRLAADTERLTRRNMKLCVTEEIQTLCYSDPELARLAMRPGKKISNCYRYINRMAKDFLQKEAEENDEKITGGIGGDVPDDMVYKWAEDYYRDLDAEEDKDKDDKFVPRTYYGGGSSVKKKEPKPKPEVKKAPKVTDSAQFSLI